MKKESKRALENVLQTIEKVAGEIRETEADAHKALFTDNDPDGYRRHLEVKSMILLDLPEAVEPLLEDVEHSIREEIMSGLIDFAKRAGYALHLGSVFYMSLLLYPDDYQEGDKNDLEELVERLRRSLPSD